MHTVFAREHSLIAIFSVLPLERRGKTTSGQHHHSPIRPTRSRREGWIAEHATCAEARIPSPPLFKALGVVMSRQRREVAGAYKGLVNDSFIFEAGDVDLGAFLTTLRTFLTLPPGLPRQALPPRRALTQAPAAR